MGHVNLCFNRRHRLEGWIRHVPLWLGPMPSFLYDWAVIILEKATKQLLEAASHAGGKDVRKPVNSNAEEYIFAALFLPISVIAFNIHTSAYCSGADDPFTGLFTEVITELSNEEAEETSHILGLNMSA